MLTPGYCSSLLNIFSISGFLGLKYINFYPFL